MRQPPLGSKVRNIAAEKHYCWATQRRRTLDCCFEYHRRSKRFRRDMLLPFQVLLLC